MTSIPANLQNYLAGSRTGQQKVQASESKDDFGKVLDRQKTGTPRENNTNAPKRAETSDSEKTQGQKDMGNGTDTRTEASEGDVGEAKPGEAIELPPPRQGLVVVP